MIDLTAIETFCRAVQLGNMTAAARGLHITKSVASRRISMLEDSLGVRLLTRSPKGVVPTDEGQQFFQRSLQILEDLEEATQSLQADRRSLTGQLRIAAPRAFTDVVLAPHIAQFATENPNIRLDLDLSDERVDLMARGYDLGLRIAGKLEDSSMIARKITELSFACVASPDYLAQHETPLHPEDLTDHSCIFYSNLAASTQWQFYIDGKKKSVQVSGRVITNSGGLQTEMVLSGAGIAYIPSFFVRPYIDSGQLIQLLPEFSLHRLNLYALYPDRSHLPAKTAAFIDYIYKALNPEL